MTDSTPDPRPAPKPDAHRDTTGESPPLSNDTLLAQARALPDAPGVYIMKDASGTEIYVGKAKSLRKRVASYFRHADQTPKTVALIGQIADFEYAQTDSELEAFLLESRLIKDLQPRYNVMLKHNDLYPFIEITMGEDFPRVRVSRRKDNPASRYFGPFVAVGDLRGCLNLLQRTFLFRPCNRALQAKDRNLPRGRGCLNLHIRRCAGPCCGRTSKEEYRKRIHRLVRFLSGGKADLLADLRIEMDEAARALQFETAAALRDLIESLQTIHTQPVTDDSLAPMAPAHDEGKALAALQTALNLPVPPNLIEGIDIANLQGQETVGSVVRFVEGMPLKDGYRRYRIRTVEGQDDFACIAEVVTRRYGRMMREGTPLPDLILIDGGKGQLRAAAEALEAVGAHPMALLSLAKQEETLFRHGQDAPVPVTKRNEGLKLLMYIRDESHRFAQHYHHILRRKAMFGDSTESASRTTSPPTPVDRPPSPPPPRRPRKKG